MSDLCAALRLFDIVLLQSQGGREGRLEEKERLRDEKVFAQVLDAGQELFGPKTCGCCMNSRPNPFQKA